MGHLCSTVVRCWGTRPTLRLSGYLWVVAMFGVQSFGQRSRDGGARYDRRVCHHQSDPRLPSSSRLGIDSGSASPGLLVSSACGASFTAAAVGSGAVMSKWLRAIWHVASGGPAACGLIDVGMRHSYLFASSSRNHDADTLSFTRPNVPRYSRRQNAA